VIFLAIPSIVLLILSLYTFHIGGQELDYTCQTGEKIDGWNVLDGTADCLNGDDEDNNTKNQDFRNWVDEQNNTSQSYEKRAFLMILGAIALGVIFYFYIDDFSWRISGYFDDDFHDIYEEDYVNRYLQLSIQQEPVSNPPQSASGANFSPEMTQSMAEYPQWTQDELQGYSDQDELQGYFDQGWSVLELYGWVLNKKRQEEDRINREEKRKEEKKFKCSYCNSGTNEVCDVPNGCKNGICKKCRESGRAKKHYRYVVTKKGWISNQVYPVHNGYKCQECSKSKWRDDGSDVGY
jgi:hypothetical protein